MSGDHAQSVRSYAAVIGDIRRSRRTAGRRELQERLEAGLQRVNEEFSDDLGAGFLVTLGDEFQGLLVRPEAVLDVMRVLDESVAGVPVRYGVGWGELSTALKELALGMDGPCFHLAREALAVAKRDDRRAAVVGFGDDDSTLNGLLWLSGSVRWSWTDVQRETVELAGHLPTQRAVAESRGVSEATVSKALRAAMHEQVISAERAAEAILARHGELAGAERGA